MTLWNDLTTEQREFALRELRERADLRELEAYDFDKGDELIRAAQSRLRATALCSAIAALEGLGR